MTATMNGRNGHASTTAHVADVSIEPEERLIETFEGEFLTRAEWLAKRKANYGMGASDAAVVVGLTGSAVKLWYQKQDLIADDFEPSEQMWFGTELEPIIAKRWTLVTGEELVAKQVFLSHPEYPWLHCTLDYLTPNGGIREIKALGLYGKDEEDRGLSFDPANPPAKWIVQAQQQMAITGEDEVVFPVFYGPELAMKTCVVLRDEQLWAQVFAAIVAFRQSLIDNVPPTEFKPDDAGVISKVYRGNNGPDITSDDPALIKIVQEHHAACEANRTSDKVKDTTRAAILQTLGNSTSANVGGWSITRSVTKSGVRLKVEPPATPPAAEAGPDMASA